MLLGGDEIGRTQRGNNNAYCQDSDISWYDWQHRDRILLEYTRRLAALRHKHPVLRRRGWFQGRAIRGAGTDIAWLRPDGSEMSEEDWDNGFAKSLMVFLNGEGIASPDARGQKVVDDSFLICFNAHFEPLRFCIPKGDYGTRWVKVLDTNAPLPGLDGDEVRAGTMLTLESRSLVLLRRLD
jgi:glycogen operon protein